MPDDVQITEEGVFIPYEAYQSFGEIEIVRDKNYILIKPRHVALQYFKQLPAEPEKSVPAYLPPPQISLEQTFGAVPPLNRPEDFASLRETAIGELTERTIKKMKGE